MVIFEINWDVNMRIKNSVVGFITFFTFLTCGNFSLSLNTQPVVLNSKAIAQTTDELKTEADQLVEQGDWFVAYEKFFTAFQYYERALKIYKQIKNFDRTQNVFNRLSYLYIFFGSPSYKKRNNKLYQWLPTEPLEEELKQARKNKDSNKQIEVLSPLASYYLAKGKDQLGLAYLEELLRISREVKNTEKELEALFELGGFYFYQRNYQKAFSYLETKLKRAQQLQNNEQELQALYDLGNFHFQNENHQKAFLYLERKLKRAQQLQNTSEELRTLSDLGYFYFRKGSHQKALTYLETRLKRAQQLQNSREKLKALSDLGIYYSKKSEYQKSIFYFIKKLNIVKKLNISQQEIKILFSIGENYLKLKNYPQAIIYLKQAWEKSKGEKPEYGLKLGTALWKNNQIAEAEEMLIKTLEVYDSQQMKPLLMEMLFSLIERDFFEFDGRFSSYDYDPIQQANQRKEKIIKGLVYSSDFLQKIILDQNKTEAALEFSEWSRVRSLTKLLTKRLQSLSKSQQAQVLEQYSEQINEQIGEYYVELMIWRIKQNKQLSPEQIQAFIQQIRQAAKETRQQNYEFGEGSDPIKKLMEKSFVLGAYRPNIKPPNIQEIKQAAQERKATIVEYSIIDEANFDSSENQKKQKLLIWVIKPTGEVKFKQVNLQSLPLSLKDLVTNSRTSIGVRSRSSFERVPESGYSSSKQLQQLHELLITPIKDFLPSDPNARVIFIPQDSLFFVPFPAL